MFHEPSFFILIMTIYLMTLYSVIGYLLSSDMIIHTIAVMYIMTCHTYNAYKTKFCLIVYSCVNIYLKKW